MDKRELAGFLRARRERITAADVGLPVGPRRRTPGLRREEVAQLAFISTQYYTLLEQGRGPTPSREVLAGLARALRLSETERDHLHHLAGVPPGPASGPSRIVRPSILELLHRLPLTAAIVVSAASEVIAWNDLAAALMEDFSGVSRRDRNLLRRALLDPHPHGMRLYGVSDVDEYARAATLDLRATAARYPDDPDVAELVAESEGFARLWTSSEVSAQRAIRKSFQHPSFGLVTVNCDVLDLADRDQHVVLYTPGPGSPSEDALRLLSVLGTQSMDVTG
jgi:transcriptional regulator with XRE-family HTH domain